MGFFKLKQNFHFKDSVFWIIDAKLQAQTAADIINMADGSMALSLSCWLNQNPECLYEHVV